jgi:hypothetical protein
MKHLRKIIKQIKKSLIILFTIISTKTTSQKKVNKNLDKYNGRN